MCCGGKLFENDVSEIESKYNKPIKIKNVNQVKKMYSYHTKKRNPHYKVRIYNNEKTKYKLKHIQGRFVPFMLSQAKRHMMKQMKPYLKHIKRVHTDGFICDQLIDIKMGHRLGKFKMKVGRCRITCVNRVYWDDDIILKNGFDVRFQETNVKSRIFNNL